MREDNETLKNWPETLQETVRNILSVVSEEDKARIKNTQERKLMSFHQGWGTGIRNDFGLWKDNYQLLESCGSRNMHRDDVSMVIIEAVWKAVQDEGKGK